MVLTCYGGLPKKIIKGWDKKQNKHIDVHIQNMVSK